MPGIARANRDLAGGILLLGSFNVLVNGSPVALRGTPVSGHGQSPHSSASVVTSSSTVRVNGRGVVRQGDAATCGHSVSTASFNVNAGA